MADLYDNLKTELRDKLATVEENTTRKVTFPELINKINVAIGMRRTGKSIFLLQTIHSLMQTENLPLECFLYLDFEDDRLLPCSQAQLRDYLEGFYQKYPENHHRLCYLFLDEIQNVEDWAAVIRRFLDTKKVKIYLSGSSAKLLSKEIATSLRGRSLATEIWPYSFKEYLSLPDINKNLQGLNLFPNSQAWHDHHFSYLKEYLKVGGFPEIFRTPVTRHRQLLQEYIEIVIMRDIVERHKVTQIALIRYIIQFLLKNSGSLFSINKLANDVKSQGFSSARDTIYDYVSYIEDAYLAFPVPLYSESLRKTNSNPRKIYAIDSGLARAISFSMNENYGHLFENLVFLDLKRKGHKIFYYLTKERYEVDFLTQDQLGKIKLYQVVWDDSNVETAARETRALEAAKAELGLEGEIITPKNYYDFAMNEG